MGDPDAAAADPRSKKWDQCTLVAKLVPKIEQEDQGARTRIELGLLLRDRKSWPASSLRFNKKQEDHGIGVPYPWRTWRTIEAVKGFC